eukprot:GFUD01027423.1.p1 GENE.GFUD01027423.1~~GFUD01027423.1.p1  ORF type:complete len:678 (+),score=252.81 GFUD01027423.1:55-2088(+)
MELLRNLGRKFLGFNREQKLEERVESGSRKRQLKEEVVSKDSLNHPVKKARIENTPDTEPSNNTQTVQLANPVQNIFSTVLSWFKPSSSLVMVECFQSTPPDSIQAFPPTFNTSTMLDTDEIQLIKVVHPKDQVSLQTTSPDTSTLSYDTLATFSGFTTAQVPPPPPHSDTSPPQSGHEKFFHKKDSAKRSCLGGSFKHKRDKKQNAFQYSAQLADREVYRQLLEQHKGTVVTYSALTNRTNILFGREKVARKGPLLGSLDVATGVDIVDPKLVPSTASQPGVTSTTIKSTQTEASKVAIETYPIFPRERITIPKHDSVLPILSPPSQSRASSRSSLTSSRTPTVKSSPSIPQVTKSRMPVMKNSLEQQLACEEVYSPKYLAKLMDKYGTEASVREKQIQREEEKKLKCEKETEELYETIEQRLNSQLKITQVVLSEVEHEDETEDEDQPTEMPELTEEMVAVIRRAERSRGEVLVNAHKIQITVNDIGTLRGLNWLNDEIINFYMQMIVTRSVTVTGQFCSVYAFTTFFYPKLKEGGHATVKRWTKKVDIFSHSLILVPVHLGMHWCLATIDMTSKVITYYDSMGGNNTNCLKCLADYLKEEHLAKKGTPLDLANWSQVIAKQIPQQMNGSDCGMFACKFAEYLSRRAKITFSQQDMPYFRRRMIYEIVKNTLMHP